MQQSTGKVWEEAKKEEDQEAVGVSCASWLLSRVQRLRLGNSLLAGVITWTDPGRVGGFTATHRGDTGAALPSGSQELCWRLQYVCEAASVSPCSNCNVINNPRHCRNSCRGKEFVLSEACWMLNQHHYHCPQVGAAAWDMYDVTPLEQASVQPEHSRQQMHANRFKPLQ